MAKNSAYNIEFDINKLEKIPVSFYQQSNVLTIAKALLGKLLITQFDDIITTARITETEAYNGIIDKASHAYGNRRTNRTEIMYAEGGHAYVYLCYGIHHLFNVVTNKKDHPNAVLIRAAEPVYGHSAMLERTGKKKVDFTLTKGPGNVSKALGIQTFHSGISLQSDILFIADDGYTVAKNNIIATPRIGVDYAGEDALLLYRFFIKENPYVSGNKLQNRR